MKKENLIWLAVGGLAVYLFLQSRKKAAAQNTTTDKPAPTPEPINTEPLSGLKPPKLMTNDELTVLLTKINCNQGGARKLITPQVGAYNASIRVEAEKRGIKAKCPDYGGQLLPTIRKDF